MKLQVVLPDGKSRQYPLEKKSNAIGRSPDSDIALEHTYVSSRHATINEIDGEYFIEDCGSRNGTFVNRLAIGAVTPIGLGDTIHIANVECFLVALPDRETPCPVTPDASTAPLTKRGFRSGLTRFQLGNIEKATSGKSPARRPHLGELRFGAAAHGHRSLRGIVAAPPKNSPESSGPGSGSADPGTSAPAPVPEKFDWNRKIASIRKRQVKTVPTKPRGRAPVGRERFGRTAPRY